MGNQDGTDTSTHVLEVNDWVEGWLKVGVSCSTDGGEGEGQNDLCAEE